MQSYTYNSDIGTFEIRQRSHEMYELWINEEMLASYESAEAAADDVANFNTGYIEWDGFHNELENFPSNIDEWTVVKEESPR